MMVKWKQCADGGCMVAVPKGTARCQAHTRKHEKEQVSGWIARPSKRQSSGRLVGRPWGRLRKRVLQRDFGLCQVCKASGLMRSGQEVDHIDSDGTDDMDNLQVICIPCHMAKTRAESNAGIAASKARRIEEDRR